MDLLEIKKQHVSAYHSPSSGLILNNDVRVLYNYCKRALVVGSHRLCVWLGDGIPTPMHGCNNCITLLQHYLRWDLMMASVRPKHVVS